MVPNVATIGHRHVAAGAPHDEATLDARGVSHRVVGDPLQRHGAAAAPALVLRHEHGRAEVVHAVRERLGREAAEDDGVRCPDARAGEHRDRQLGDHPQVERDVRALLDAELLQRVREADDLALQVGVRERAAIAFGLALPKERDALAESRLDVPVDAVEADVELAAREPLRIRQLPLEHGVERLEPRHALTRLARPELLQRNVVDRGLRVRLRRELLGRRIPALLEQQRVDGLIAHSPHTSRSYGKSVSTSQPSSVTSTRSSSRTPPTPLS